MLKYGTLCFKIGHKMAIDFCRFAQNYLLGCFWKGEFLLTTCKQQPFKPEFPLCLSSLLGSKQGCFVMVFIDMECRTAAWQPS